MDIPIKDIPKIWIKDELKSQRSKLQNAQKATQWSKIEAYQKFIQMRKELVTICEKYAAE